MRRLARRLFHTAGTDAEAAGSRKQVQGLPALGPHPDWQIAAGHHGNGFNAIRFDPRKPAHTIRRMDSNLGMGGAMRWDEKRRFSLPEFKRFGSFPDDFVFAGEFEEGIKQIGNCVPPLFMKAIAEYICRNLLPGTS